MRSSWTEVGGHEAAPDEAVGEKIGDPHRVVHVSLPPGDVPAVRRVGEDQVEAAFEHVPDRPPVNAGRLHGDVGDAVAGQPVRQLQQGRGRGREGLDLLLDTLRRPDSGAGDHTVLVDVESGAPWRQDFPGSLLAWWCRHRAHVVELSCACFGGDPLATVRGARGAPGPTDLRAHRTKKNPTSVPTRRPQCPGFIRRESSQSVTN